MPWNAAFATVLLAGFVTVFWHGHEVPDAQPDSAAQTPSGGHAASASPPVPAVAKAEAPAEPASVAGARSATQPHQDRRVERERAADAARAREAHTAPAERRPAGVPPAAPSPPAEPVFPRPAPVPPELAAVTPPAASPAPPVMAAAPAPVPATADSARHDGNVAGFAAGSAVRPSARAAARNSALAEAQPAAPPAAKAAAGPVLLPPAVPADWAQARVAIDGGAASGVPRARSGALHQRLQQVLAGWGAETSGNSGTGAAPQGRSVRVELLNAAGDRLALLTVEGGAVRWVVVAPEGAAAAERATLGRADAAALEALLAELDRLAGAH